MKKRIMAAVLGFAIIFSTFSSDLVSQAEGVAETQQVEEQTQLETPETEIITEEQKKEEVPINKEEEKEAEEPVVTEDVEQPETSVSTVPEETTPEEVVSEETEAEEVAFSQSRDIDGVRISMSAAAGVLPKDSHFEAVAITGKSNISKIEDAVEKNLADTKSVVEVKAFDITIYDVNGNEVQPDTSKGNVQVTFNNIDTAEVKADANKDMEVFHIADSMQSAESVDTSVGDGQVSFEAEHFSTYAMVTVVNDAKESVESDDPYALVDKFEITGLDLSTDSTNPTKLNKSQEISVQYTFKKGIKLNAEPKTKTGIYIKTGEQYQLPSIPSGCVPTKKTIAVPFGTETLGTIHFNDDGTAYIEITYNPSEPQEVTIDPAGFVLEFKFKNEASSTQQEYELAFGNTTYYVKIADFMAQKPTFTKTGSDIDSDGNITWTVTVKNNAKPIEYDGGYTFTDTIGTGHTYVDGSFTGGTLESSGKSNLVWSCEDNNANATHTFTYKTHVDFLALTKDANEDKTVNKDVENAIVVTATPKDTADYDKLNEKITASSSVSKAVTKWINKTGGEIVAQENNTGVATWEITIKNNGYTLSNVVLHDVITVDTGVDVTISDLSIDGMTKNTDYTVSAPSTGVGQEIAFKNSMKGDATYTISYKTTIANYKEYLKANHSIPTNKAWVTYTYDSNGDGTGDTDVVGPDVIKNFTGAGISANAALKKTFKSYDAKNHTMTWEVTVNDNAQTLYNVVVTDTLPEGHIYDDSCSVTGADDVSVSADKKTVTVKLGDLTASKSFTIVTKLEDSESAFWASNQKTKTYTNKVAVNSFEDAEKTTANAEVTASATGKYESTVLTKAADSYDYNSHRIRYELTINNNNTELNNVDVNDSLNSKVKLVDGSVKIISGEDSITNFSYTETDNNLKLSFDQLTKEVKVEFYVEVVDDSVFSGNETTTITNAATIISDEYKEEVSSGTPVETQIDNIKFNKTSGTITNDIVPYSIKINQAQKPLYEDGVDEVYVFDTLGASLTLDKDSVKLYEATVSSDGTMTKSNDVTNLDDITFGKDGRKTTLKVVLPKTSNAYILEYSAAMTNESAKDFNNSAVLKAGQNTSQLTGSVDLKEYSWAGAQMSNMVYCIVELTDEQTHEPIEGAEFDLYDGEEKIDSGITDENGDIYFVGGLEENHNYQIKETKSIGIYVVPDELKDGTVEVTGVKGLYNASDSKTEVTNSKPKKTITVELFDQDDNTVDLTSIGTTPGIISITNGGIEVWNSSTFTTPFEAVYGQEYEVKESQVPFGYVGDSTDGLKFRVEDDTTSDNYGKIVIVENTIGATNTESSITMYDHKLKSVEVSINDVSDQGRYLSGAKFTLAYKTTDNVVKEWVSDGSFETLTLPEGDYWLTRTDAPLGFLNESKAIKFTVSSSLFGNTVTFKDSSNVGDIQIIANENKVVVPETPDSSSAVTLTDFAPTKDGEPSDEIKTKIYTVTYEDGIPSGLSDAPVWDSDTATGDPVLNPETEYVIVSTDSDGNMTSKVVMVQVYEDEDGTIKTKLIEKPTLRGSDYVDVPVEYDEEGNPLPITIKMDVKSPVAPTPAPSESSASENTGFTLQSGIANTASNNGSYTAKKDNQELALKEKDIIVGADLDENNQDVNADSLAKTGGFVGTLFGYLTAVALILAGLYLTLGKKKEHDK
ncbi:Uncharacterized surface anchored protein [Pseudobutyrivibrio sp. C4]|uniref:collagen binding domain-containing protein n=1 Tax=Pseudobutyrivibrio sp. C4 TaxID=1520803 RepID=UPI0008B49E5D|nr:collagen binding domain-containing protein [Pseudobutyrivibrio sp. C4]SES94533.1 Uncharacterized surface anchored protein [Pseudobutyrivibrio sp. C4]